MKGRLATANTNGGDEGRAGDRAIHNRHVTRRRDAFVWNCLLTPNVRAHSLAVLILIFHCSKQHASTKGQVCGTSTKT